MAPSQEATGAGVSAGEPVVRELIYVDGEWVKPSGTETFDVINASTEEVIGRVPLGTAADVDRAVEAARRAFESWSTTTPAERKVYLERLQAAIQDRSEEIATTVAAEVGMPLTMARVIQAGVPAQVAGKYAALLDDYDFEEQIGNSRVVREPIGVVGCITPWNFPLHQVICKVAPALAAGCTVVLKPTEVAPLASFMLAEIFDEIGLPPGVFNLVSGTGEDVGEAIAAHPDIDMVSFTGSTRAGRRVSELASQTVKKVALELGGKSPFVILDDADLQEAIQFGLGRCYINSGQTCTAWTRMLVPRERQDEAVEIAKQMAEAWTVGDPFAEDSKLGPLVSETQRDRVRSYIRKGVEEGAVLVTGGEEPPEGLDRGYYVRPTVFADVDNDMTIAQEEIFGPVLAIIPYDDDDDAVRIANDTIYGLQAAVYSSDSERAERIARRIRAGQVHVNDAPGNLDAPFGGYKQSGIGREWGRYGLEEYLEVKSLQLKT